MARHSVLLSLAAWHRDTLKIWQVLFVRDASDVLRVLQQPACILLQVLYDVHLFALLGKVSWHLMNAIVSTQ